MNGKEKIIAALSPSGTSEIPAVLCYEGIYLRDHWNQILQFPWWYHNIPDIDIHVDWRTRFIENTEQDWYYLPECETRDNRQNQIIVQRDGKVFLLDKKTNAVTYLEEPVIGGWSRDKNVQSVHPTILPESPNEIDKMLPSPPVFDKTAFVDSGRTDLANKMLTGKGSKYFPIRHVVGPLWDCYHLWGFEEWMVKIASEPELVHYASQRELELALYDVRVSSALGTEGIWIEDCLVDMISRKAYQSINLPLIQTLVEEIHSLGMKCIYYYCGDPNGKMDLLLESGADALSFEESKKGFLIDIADIATYVNGRCCLLGNLDAIHILPDASESDLRLEIQRQIRVGWMNKGRFIMSIGSPVTPGTSPERVRLYTSIVHELGIG